MAVDDLDEFDVEANDINIDNDDFDEDKEDKEDEDEDIKKKKEEIKKKNKKITDEDDDFGGDDNGKGEEKPDVDIIPVKKKKKKKVKKKKVKKKKVKKKKVKKKKDIEESLDFTEAITGRSVENDINDGKEVEIVKVDKDEKVLKVGEKVVIGDRITDKVQISLEKSLIILDAKIEKLKETKDLIVKAIKSL